MRLLSSVKTGLSDVIVCQTYVYSNESTTGSGFHAANIFRISTIFKDLFTTAQADIDYRAIFYAPLKFNFFSRLFEASRCSKVKNAIVLN